MKTICRALLLSLLLPLALLANETPATEAEAIARLRELYRLVDHEAVAREGLPLIIRYPASTELRAWYVAGLSRIDTEKGMEMARQLRYAHPNDPWSWFALAIAQLESLDQFHLAPEASEKMLSLYKGSDPEVFRMHAHILRSLDRLDDVDKYLAGKAEPWAMGEKAISLDTRSWRDQTLVDAGQAALIAAEAADPSDVRVVLHHARSLAGRRRREEATPLFLRALQLSPDSLTVRVEYWRSLGKEKQDVAAADIAAFLARNSSPSALLAAARTYRDVGLEEKSAELKQKVLAEFPQSVQAEMVAWGAVSDYARENRDKPTPEVNAELIRRWRAFVDYPFHHFSGRYLGHAAYPALFRLLKDDGPAEEFLAVVDAWIAFSEPHETAAPVAEALATRELRLEQAEKLGRIALRDATVRLEREAAYYPKERYAEAVGAAKGVAHSALGWALLKRKKYEEAGKHLREAVKQHPRYATAYHHLGQWYEARKQLTKADETYTAGMTVERGPDKPNTEALRALYVRRHGSEEGWPAYLEAAKEGTASKAKRAILASRIVPARPIEKPFSLKTLAGDRLSYEALGGKVAVVKFWGVWCGPCVAEMPDFQKLVDKYASDPKVAIVTIDTDKDPETARKFMEKNQYRFPVLLDDGWISRATGINSYPTAWFLGEDGRIAFEKQGVSVDLVNEYTWRIEALKRGGGEAAQ